MKIGDRQLKEIIVYDKKGNVIAVISDEEIVEHKDYKVHIND